MTASNQTDSDFLFQLDEFYLDLREDGRTISFLEKKEIEKRPFPGLRPFKTSEFQIFNGRDGQAEELINRLRKNHFLAVIGSSGTGKSSLVRAGLIPQLLAGYLQEAGTNWDIAVCRPGKNPVENLAVALARIKCRSNNNEKLKNDYHLTGDLLSRSIYGILDFNEIQNPPNQQKEEKSNLLIIVDQFEELFRFNRDDLGDPDIEIHFINLLLNASVNPAVSIYVVATMRSEFLGDCAKYRGLPEAINEGQYLVPQLSREQIKEVIEDPILIAGKKIAPGLVELLVNEIEESKAKRSLDQLPILQHALMRTYQEAMKEAALEITYKHYLATGGLKDALAKHAQTKYNELADGVSKESFKQQIAKITFQALTDASTDQKKGRRPTELSVLYEIAGSMKASSEQVNEVVNHFRDTETSFIMPPSNTPLYPGLIIDISHESLMRQWGMLKDWVANETENGKLMMRLAEYQNLNKLGDKDYMVGKELKLFSTWFKSFKPQDSWAKRYSIDYKESFAYLDSSVTNQRRKKMKIFWLSLGALFIICSTFFLITFYQKNQARIALNPIFLEKRADAVKYERRLQALFFTAEVLALEKNEAIRDSIIKQSVKEKLIPNYTLQQVYPYGSMVMRGAISKEGNTFFIWRYDSTFSEVNIETGDILHSGNYEMLEEDTNDSNLVKTSYFKLLYDGAGNFTRDTVLTDSSSYYKREYFNTILEKDEFGAYTFPLIVKSIAGAYYKEDLPKKINWLTWGENTESIFTAVDMWDKYGYAAGTSLIHDGAYGAAMDQQSQRILTWGSDSAVKVWQLNNDTAMLNLPPALLKKKIQVDTGVELDEVSYRIERISYPDYFRRKQEFLKEYQAYKENAAKK